MNLVFGEGLIFGKEGGKNRSRKMNKNVMMSESHGTKNYSV